MKEDEKLLRITNVGISVKARIGSRYLLFQLKKELKCSKRVFWFEIKMGRLNKRICFIKYSMYFKCKINFG